MAQLRDTPLPLNPSVWAIRHSLELLTGTEPSSASIHATVKELWNTLNTQLFNHGGTTQTLQLTAYSDTVTLQQRTHCSEATRSTPMEQNYIQTKPPAKKKEKKGQACTDYGIVNIRLIMRQMSIMKNSSVESGIMDILFIRYGEFPVKRCQALPPTVARNKQKTNQYLHCFVLLPLQEVYKYHKAILKVPFSTSTFE